MDFSKYLWNISWRNLLLLLFRSCWRDPWRNSLFIYVRILVDSRCILEKKSKRSWNEEILYDFFYIFFQRCLSKNFYSCMNLIKNLCIEKTSRKRLMEQSLMQFMPNLWQCSRKLTRSNVLRSVLRMSQEKCWMKFDIIPWKNLKLIP